MTERRWRSIGGRQGGTVSALAFSPNYSADQMILAATLAGVHRSTDAGQTWSNASLGLLNPFVDSIAFSPNFAEDGIVFVGGRESGVSRSTDRGETWQPLHFWSNTPPSIASLVVSPQFASDATVFAGAEDGRVYRTTNAGRSWDAMSIGLPGAPVLALAIMRGYSGDAALFAGTADGLYRSNDDGETWESANLNGLVIQCVALSPAFEMDGTIIVGTEQSGILRTADAGERWIPASEGLTDLCINGLALSPGFSIDGTALAATAAGVARTEDDGRTWTMVHDGASALCVAVPPPPQSPDFDIDLLRVGLAGTAQGGVLRSPDGGRTWADSNQGLAAHLLVALAISPAFGRDHTMFTAGLEDGVQRSTDGGSTWVSSADGLASLEVAALAVSPAFERDRVVVAATAAGVARSHDAGQSWEMAGGPTPAQSVALAPNFGGSGAILAAGPTAEVMLSSDGGTSWQALQTPFAGEDIAALAFSPHYAHDNTFFVATSRPEADGMRARTSVWQTSDAGATWDAVMEAAQQHRWLALALPPSYSRDGAFYIGAGERVLRPMRKAVESRLGARRPVWIGENVGSVRTTVVALALSPTYAEDQTLFAATSTGVYVSRSAGLSWQPLQDGLDDRSIVGLVVSPEFATDRTVFAAGLGGTIWRYQDA